MFNTQRNFFSNIFNIRLLEPVCARPADREGQLHLLHREAAESMVMKTWSIEELTGRQETQEHSALNMHQTRFLG